MNNHVHRWKIDPPSGSPIVGGVCACGAVHSWPMGLIYSFNWQPRRGVEDWLDEQEIIRLEGMAKGDA